MKIFKSYFLVVVCFGYAYSSQQDYGELRGRPPPQIARPRSMSSGLRTSQESPEWKKFIEEAATCTAGEGRMDPDGCNWCNCVETGVMICSRKKCVKKREEGLSGRPPRIASRPRLQKLKKLAEEAATCNKGDRTKDSDGCNWCECIQTGVMICRRMKCVKKLDRTLTAQIASRPNLQNLKEFAEESASCTVGERTNDPDGCNWCECVRAGVMLCSRKICLPESDEIPSVGFSVDQDASLIITSEEAESSRKGLSDPYKLHDQSIRWRSGWKED